jgi:hypothetical protein
LTVCKKQKEIDSTVLRNSDTLVLQNVEIDENGKIGFYPEFKVVTDTHYYGFLNHLSRE